MLIGIPKEIKSFEHRVGMTPASVREAIALGHDILVEKNAGHEIGFDDAEYEAAGAMIAGSSSEVFGKAEMVLKVKEPQPSEISMLREGQILFTYLHLAPDESQTQALIDSGCIAIAYETVTDDRGGLPLLAPMSEVAGRMAVQAGATCLEIANGGRGVLLGGVPGVAPGKVVVIGGGVVGSNSIFVATGMGGQVTVIDRDIRRLAEIDAQYKSLITTRFSNQTSIEEEVLSADLVIGAVLVPGAEAPKVVTADMVKRMKRGSVIVDVAIDQGGCIETSQPTTHAHPTYIVDDVVHYCVTNMPGAVARTSTFALNNATMPFALKIAEMGVARALSNDPHLMKGLNIHCGKLTYQAVAMAQNRDYTPPEIALEI
ncbi:MAG: alanine dehydrogenase [Pseudomonadota bacterium]|nr:alanine dehydrogenase [Alphaproteobacteria bacterium]MEC7943062.1 alanine dehydrogenase [Pseudomonadota bacterium]MEC8289754.1 alanine dehydrogenase [Pseudomonadota bacterium]MEC8530921.1 alanine dehydrogenase [Pseudomonadota bacterium]MEC8725094.1 alanine dehydrogenase [Pseudomonadota bacterium]